MGCLVDQSEVARTPHSHRGCAAEVRALADNSDNGGGRQRRQNLRQQQGHTTINQQMATIASVTVFVVTAVATIVGAGNGGAKRGSDRGTQQSTNKQQQ